MTNKCSIGIDIGGSHLSCAAFDLIDKKLLDYSFADSKIDKHSEADIIFSIWAQTIQKTLDKVGKENVLGFGFAFPGPFDYENGIPLFTGNNSKFEKINGLNISKNLRNMLGLFDEFSIRFINDATAFAVGEDWIGKAKGTKKTMSITLGTGLGSAFIENSLPVLSGGNVPKFGCVWHLPFKNSIADDYFSTRGLISRYLIKTGKIAKNVKEIATLAQNDDLTKEVFVEFGIDLVGFLKPWLEKFGVEKIILGGNIARAERLFLPAMESTLLKEGLSSITIEITELGETASIVGGARLLEPAYWLKVKDLLKEM